MYILDQIWPFWAKNPNFTEGSKSFDTHVTEKPPRQFWAKFGCFWAKNSFFWVDGVKLLVSSYQGTNETPFLC